MNWHRLHDELYYVDGTWRDIYVKQVGKDDWKKWINFINNNHQVVFYNGLTQVAENKIDFSVVLDYWTGKTKYWSHAIIILDTVKINCRHFYSTEIENDFDPRDINFTTDHEIILRYMSDVSKLLGKTVVLTPENLPDQVYISMIDGVEEIFVR